MSGRRSSRHVNEATSDAMSAGSASSSSSGASGRPSFGGGNGAQVQAIHDDKQNLHDINQALRNYIEYMRAEDAKQAQQPAADDHRTEEIKRLRSTFTSEMEKALELIAGTTKELEQKSDELADAQRECEDLRKQLEQSQKRQQLEADARARAANELKEARARLAQEEAERNSIERAARADAKKLEDLMRDFRDLQAESNQLHQAKQELENKLNMTLKELEDLRAEHDGQFKYFEDKFKTAEEFTSTFDEPRINHAVLQKLFEDARASASGDQGELLRQLQEEYEEKIESYRRSLEASAHNLQEERTRNRLLVKQVEEAAQAAEEQAREIARLQQTIEELHQEMEAMNDRFMKDKDDWNKVIFEKNAQIRDLKDSFDAKVREFEDLMGVKVALALELDVYRRLLEAEEARLGIVGQALASNPASPSSFGGSVASVLATPTRRGRQSIGAPSSAAPAAPSTTANDAPSSGWFSFFSPRTSSKVAAAATAFTPAPAPAPAKEEEKPAEAEPVEQSSAAQVESPDVQLGKKRGRSSSRLAAREEPAVEEQPAPAAASESTATSRRRTRHSMTSASQERGEPQITRRTTRSSSRQSGIAQELEEAATKSAAKPRTRKSLAATAIAEEEEENVAAAVAAAAAAAEEAVGTTSQSSQASEDEASILVSGRDQYGQYVCVINGQQAQLNLGGWRLKTSVSEYEFPEEAVVGPSDRLFIRLASSEAEAEQNNLRDQSGNSYWISGAMWAENTDDECSLLSPEGVKKASVSIQAPKGRGACTIC